MPPPTTLLDPRDRRSVRSLGPMPLHEIVNLLRFVLRPLASHVSGGLRRDLRITASAGALHSVEPLVVIPGRRRRLLRYDSENDSIQLLAVPLPGALDDLAERVAQLAPKAAGPTVVLVGDLRRLRAAYEEPESLLWRDAGALLQSMAFAATAYRVGFCPLGIHGAEVVEAAFGDAVQDLHAVGVAVVGRPVPA